MQIKFVEWTAEGRLRHSAFLGLRSDKHAKDVRREDLTKQYGSIFPKQDRQESRARHAFNVRAA